MREICNVQGPDLSADVGRWTRGKMNVMTLTCLTLMIVVMTISKCTARSRLAFWIDAAQLEKFAGTFFEGLPLLDLYIIDRGVVNKALNEDSLKDSILKNLILPPNIDTVNLTWEAGDEKFTYWFDDLKSKNKTILYDPLLSIPSSGIIPRGPKIFQVSIPCTGKDEGVAHLVLNLHIMDQSGRPVRGTPFKLRIKKLCNKFETTNLCNQACQNYGRCNQFGECECPQGYHGQFCEKDLCNPKCENNGTCISPDMCLCLDGFSGKRCEKALCSKPCLNGGRCVQLGISQAGICWCTSGFIGEACEFSQCKKPCKHRGLCVGVNKCKCKDGYSGDQCEEGLCNRTCLNDGKCIGPDKCDCKKGYIGDYCEEVLDRDVRWTPPENKTESEVKCDRLKREIKKRCEKNKVCKSKQNRIASRCKSQKPKRQKRCKKRQAKLAKKCVRQRDKRQKRCKTKKERYKNKCRKKKDRNKRKRTT